MGFGILCKEAVGCVTNTSEIRCGVSVSFFWEVVKMDGRRCLLVLLSLVVSCGIVPSALAQKLTSEWVEKMARPLVEKHAVDGLSVGYLEGENFGIVHLGSANAANEKASMATIYELGSVSK